jgi:hypothetical protein
LKCSFQPIENYSRDLFRTFLAQKVVFGKVTYWPCDVFIFIFTSVQLSYSNWKGKILRSQGEKQNEASLSGSNFRKLYVKKAFFWRKKSHNVISPVKKS